MSRQLQVGDWWIGHVEELPGCNVQERSLDEARESLKKIDAILVDAQAIAGNARAASTDLAALRSEVDANLRKVSRMIDEVNRRWPFAKSPEIKLP